MLWTAGRRGKVAAVVAVAMLLTIAAAGCGIDLGRAYLTRRQLAATAALTCQYAGHAPVRLRVTRNSPATTLATVPGGLGGLWGAPDPAVFTYNVSAAGVVTAATDVPTLALWLVGVNTLPVSVARTC